MRRRRKAGNRSVRLFENAEPDLSRSGPPGEVGSKLVLDALPDMVWLKRPDGANEYVNAKYLEMTALAPDHILGWSWLEVVHPDDVGVVLARWDEALATGHSYETEVRLRTAAGTYRWVLSRGNPVRDGAGEVLAWVGTVTDIDDRKKLEASLRKSNEELAASNTLLDALQMTAPVGLGFVDRRLRKVKINDALARLNGQPVEALVGRPAAEVTPDLWPQLEPIFTRVLESGEAVVNFELARPDQGSGPAYYLSSFYPVRIEDEVTGVGVVVVDITRRRMAEEALAENLEALVRAIATTVEVRDPYTAGHQARVARLASAIAEEMGLDAGTVHGIATAAGIHDIGKIAVAAEILSRPGRLSELEFELVKQHPRKGHDIVAGIAFPWPVAQMILQHHERVDGSGYPDHLVGEEISLGARIIAVADVVEAMSSHRPYRPSLGLDVALKEIERQRGQQLDKDAVDACMRLFTQRSFRIEPLTPAEVLPKP